MSDRQKQSKRRKNTCYRYAAVRLEGKREIGDDAGGEEDRQPKEPALGLGLQRTRATYPRCLGNTAPRPALELAPGVLLWHGTPPALTRTRPLCYTTGDSFPYPSRGVQIIDE